VAQRLLITGSSLMAVVCLVAAFGVWYANHRLEDLERVVITHASQRRPSPVRLTDTAAPASAVDETPGNAQNFLLIGSDARREACTAADSPFAGGLGNVTSELSDTIILVRVDPATGQAAILSFPRDLWVTIARHRP
jgi:anionic cell wall polymer biosynthesis LytR-Cps2A-Psr (LCP) family protein